MTTADDVRRIAVALPGAYEQESYGGRPSWRLRAPKGIVKQWDSADGSWA